MKNFHCDNCQAIVYFENLACANCGHVLAFVPELGEVTALAPADGEYWRRALPAVAKASYEPTAAEPSVPRYRKCQNYAAENICNWAVAADDPNPLCISCRLTQVIPDLDQPGHRDAWFRLEAAKRRLLFSLLELRLPLPSKLENASDGVSFQFLADPPAVAGTVASPVLTGHDEGTIVINVAEADDAERERRRVQMHEPYRTLLGHLRHEIGHYYWDRLIRDSDRLQAYRELFGDETLDYATALQTYYDKGAPPDWQQKFVSTYAGSHPWEDWAETWAHYLHITDTLETADACGLSLQPQRSDEPGFAAAPVLANPADRTFEQMIERWFPLTYLLNNLNRGLGQADAYPFVLSEPALEKLRFVHDTVSPQSQVQQSQPMPPKPLQAPAEQDLLQTAETQKMRRAG